MTGPDRSPVRDPENRSGAINVAAQVKAILIELRDKRKRRIEERRNKRIEGKEHALMKRVLDEEPAVGKFSVSAEEFAHYQKSLELGEHKIEKILAKPLKEEEKLIMNAPFKYARRRGDEDSESKALSSHRRPTKLERFQQRVLNDENGPLSRLRGLYNSARSITFRPTVRQQPQMQPSLQNKPNHPQTRLELLGKQVEKRGDRVPLRKVTFYVMGRYSNVLPHADKFRLPKWAEDTLTARGYRSKDVLNWIQVMRATNATQAFEIMERNGAVWPKFLIQSMLYSSTPRSQGELVEIFSVVQEIWDTFDQQGKIKALIRMAELSSKKLPQGLPRVANLLATTDFVGSKSALRVCNEVLAITADA